MLAAMLDLVVALGAAFNLTFSSSQDPRKCKSFCLYFVGARTARQVDYPDPLLLYGVRLPWRERAVHLGHTVTQNLTMDADAEEKRARFISRSVEVRNQFSFAAPAQILKAVRILACDAYGSMLWRLDSPKACSFFKSYTSCLRRIWRLPLNTFTYIVEGHLARSVPSFRNMVLSRLPGFFQRLLGTPSGEVAIMAQVAAADARTVLAGNLAFVSKLTKLDLASVGSRATREALPVEEVPESEQWRLGLLDILLRQRADQEKLGSDTKRVTALLSSLCTS